MVGLPTIFHEEPKRTMENLPFMARSPYGKEGFHPCKSKSPPFVVGEGILFPSLRESSMPWILISGIWVEPDLALWLKQGTFPSITSTSWIKANLSFSPPFPSKERHTREYPSLASGWDTHEPGPGVQFIAPLSSSLYLDLDRISTNQI